MLVSSLFFPFKYRLLLSGTITGLCNHSAMDPEKLTMQNVLKEGYDSIVQGTVTAFRFMQSANEAF